MLSQWLTGGNFSISFHFLLRPLRLPRGKTKKQCKTQHHVKINSDSKQHKIKSLLHRSVRLLFTSKKKSIDKDIQISNKLYVEKLLYKTLQMQKVSLQHKHWLWLCIQNLSAKKRQIARNSENCKQNWNISKVRNQKNLGVTSQPVKNGRHYSQVTKHFKFLNAFFE